MKMKWFISIFVCVIIREYSGMASLTQNLSGAQGQHFL